MKKNSADSRKARAMLIFSRVLVYALLVFLSVLCLFSFYMLIVNASRTNADLQGGFKALPQGHFLENLVNAWNDSSINIPRGMLNSFIVAAATAVLSTYFSALTAYGLHAYNFRLDLAMSTIKRTVGIKDFGEILPGHGGILDRFDSFLFAAPFAVIYGNMTGCFL